MAIYLYTKNSKNNNVNFNINEAVIFIKNNKILDTIKTDIKNKYWQGGKKKGSILDYGNGLFFAMIANKCLKSFQLQNYMNESKLRESAERFLYTKSLELGIVTNRYKIILHKDTNYPQYLLVQLSKNYVMLCDYDQLEIIKKYHFFITTIFDKKK